MTYSQSWWQIGAAVCGTSQKQSNFFPPWSCNSWLISGEIWASPSLSVMLMKFTEISWEAGDRHRGWLTARLVFTRKGSLLFLRSGFRDAWFGHYSQVGPLKTEMVTDKGAGGIFSPQAALCSNTGILLTAKLGEANQWLPAWVQGCVSQHPLIPPRISPALWLVQMSKAQELSFHKA